MKSALSAHLKSVLYVDRGMLVLNKLSGLTCQLTGERHRTTRPGDSPSKDKFNHLLAGLQKKYDLPSPLLPVHRLDMGTTGCLALAVTQRSAQEMSRQFAKGTVHKTYLALIRGDRKTLPGLSGVVNDPILYDDGYFDGFGEDGSPSITHWKLLGDSPIAPVSLVELKLLTGNKHQLRIHLSKSLGAPILGDEKYSRTPISEAITSQSRIPPNRIFLHASHLSLFRYRSGGGHKRFRLGIQAPLPTDFVGVCKRLQLPIPPVNLEGGLFVDGEPVADNTIPELQGRWEWPEDPSQRPC